MAEQVQDLIWDASVDMLGQLPSIALKGASLDDVKRLLRKYHDEGARLKDMFK